MDVINQTRAILNSYLGSQSEQEYQLQIQRKKVCYGDDNRPNCDKLRQIVGVFVCGECGCPIEKLTRNISDYNKCSLNKWQ
jgi:hypothetical protein